MTMPKREVNNIWARVRDDVDVDDLIFNYEAYHTSEDDGGSDRRRSKMSGSTLMNISKPLRRKLRGVSVSRGISRKSFSHIASSYLGC